MKQTIQQASREAADLLSECDKHAEQAQIQARRAWLSAATQLYKALAGESNDIAGGRTQVSAGQS